MIDNIIKNQRYYQLKCVRQQKPGIAREKGERFRKIQNIGR